MINTGLKDKVILISGANHGIGATTAKAMAKEGAKVFITYWRPKVDEQPNTEKQYQENRLLTADKIVQEIRHNGGQAESLEVDLSDPQNIPTLFDKAEENFGSVSVLVNNAAYCNSDTFIPGTGFVEEKTGLGTNTINITIQEMHFAVNTQATSLMMEEFAKRHVARKSSWGRIVNISTDWAECFPSSISYGASKTAMEAYSRSAAVELGKFGITVNIVSPGPIQTGWMSSRVEEVQAKKCPLGRIGQPEDVADVIVFLASEQARWITGQRLFVGGGNRII
ncbi:MAG: SDR family oxidoreductase [Patescibacteria group bacterium]|nr:SDR family oxidoreductase [Patescibacteria group bacterium]MCL5095897.1 SDR family oxidoreductase [Patescibacteria group bacterium]